MTVVRTQIAGLYTDNLTEVGSANTLELINCIPQNDESGVLPTQAVNLQVVNTVDGTIDNTAKVEIEDPPGSWTTAYDEAAGGFQTGFTGTTSRVHSPNTAVLDELWLSISRTVPWGSLRQIGVRVSAAASAVPFTWTYHFHVADTEAPTITELLWFTPRKCRIRFSEAMNTAAEKGSTLFHHYVTGGVRVLDTSSFQLPPGLPDSGWVGSYLDHQGSIYPRNTKQRAITAVELDPSLVPTGKVTVDVSSGNLEADDGIDYGPSGTIARRRPLRVTVGPYRFEARLSSEGAGDDNPYTEEKIQTSFCPLIRKVYLPELEDVPAGDVVAQYVILELEDDISLGRLYTLHVHDVEDDDGNNASHITLDFTSPMFGYPETRQQLWKFFPGGVMEEDLLTESQLRKMSVVLQDLLNVLWLRSDRLDQLLDPWLCPENLLDHLLFTLGNPFKFPLTSVKLKRRVAEAFPELFVRRGTKPGIRDIVKLITGIDGFVTPFWPGDTWKLGTHDLGIGTYLGPSSAYLRNCYDFDVSPTVLTDEQRRIIREICTWADPANMHLRRILEGVPTPVPGDEWLLGKAGYSEVGLTTKLT